MESVSADQAMRTKDPDVGRARNDDRLRAGESSSSGKAV